ncbi:uroporphyrinogen decarboxylase family protein [Clostridium thailandense]|uniref:uroporphyrinogen decarboxylase family protein n=1 Tax=Clostridium thailandense TaxID=2794346 RepID=UPI003988C845
MKTNQELYNERLNRIKTAVALGEPDRVPVLPVGSAFCAQYKDVKLSEFAMNPRLCNKTMLEAYTSLGEIDGVQQQVFYPFVLCPQWFSNIELPGRELGENKLWQMAEAELMTVEDYDVIIEKGYNAFLKEFQANKLDHALDKVIENLAPFTAESIQNFADAGLPVLAPFVYTTPYEYFCGGRSMVRFMKDLYKIPDKVQAAMDVAMVDYMENMRKEIRTFKPLGAWVGGWRSASSFLAPKFWNRFVWPYFKQLVNLAIEEGIIPILHLDSNWERDLEFFKELPKGKCIITPDGSTDIYKIKEVLGDHMCIMGDVTSAMFSVATPDEVYNYSKKLINDLGPSGFILASGCDIPYNAKPENVKAMIAAATGDK